VIKAVIFDFFGVICSDEYWQFIQRDSNLRNKFDDLSNSLNLGEIAWDDFVTQLSKKIKQDPKTVNKLFQDRKLNPVLINYIHSLHKKYKTAILSNASQGQIKKILEGTKTEEAFDLIVVSSDLGIMKPDPQIFKYTLKQLGISPAETIFVDDIERYCVAAEEIGIKAIRYENFGQTKKELEKLLAANSDN
jgi:epoxide hydrolase-like predicted phosphatase